MSSYNSCYKVSTNICIILSCVIEVDLKKYFVLNAKIQDIPTSFHVKWCCLNSTGECQELNGKTV